MIASEPMAGEPGVRGVVLGIEDGRALPNARVRVLPGQTAWQSVSADGRFRIATRAGAAGTLEVRASGYDGVSAALPARGDSGTAVVAVLGAMRMSHRPKECAGSGIAPSDEVAGF